METQALLGIIAGLLFWRLAQSYFQHQDIKSLFGLSELRHDRMMKHLRLIALRVRCIEEGTHPTEEDYQNIWRPDPSAPYGDGRR